MLKRRIKVLLKVLIALMVFILGFLLFERVRGQISLARYKRELAVRGETLDVHKLTAPPVAAADNGAAEILRLKALIQEGKTIPMYAPPKMKLIAPGKALIGFHESFWVDVGDKVTNTWTGVVLDLAPNQTTLEQLRITLAKPAFDCRPDYSRGFEMPLPHLAQTKTLGQWFGPLIQNSLRIGDNKTAFNNLIAAITLPRLLENDRVLISELVRIAISSMNLGVIWEALQTDAWTDEQLTMMQAAWEKNTFATNMVQALNIERAIGDTYYERFRKSNSETYKHMYSLFALFLNDEDDSNASRWWQNEFIREQVYCRVWRFAWAYQDEKFYLAGMDQLIHNSLTGAEKAARAGEDNWLGLPFGKTVQQNFYNNWRYRLSAQTLGSLHKVAAKAARAETDRSMVLCAIALKRYSLRHGKPAPDLNLLVPEFLSSVPTDYMDGKPIKYRLNKGGTWVLYSVGDDGRDDGGDPTPAKPMRSYQWTWRGKDAVWPAPATAEEIGAWRNERTKN